MFDHYIAVDWAKTNMAIARITKGSEKPKVVDVPTDLEEFKVLLKSLRGTKILTLEETTTAHWLYVELRPFVDELLVCDPYRNKLLSEGPKNDKIDAVKLAQLLKANLLKPVFHSNDKLLDLRKLVSGYDDLIQRGVRLKNQRNALLRAKGKNKEDTFSLGDEAFVIDRLDRAIEAYEKERDEYIVQFEKHSKTFPAIRNLKGIPGIGIVGAVKIAAIVVSASRFPHKNDFHAYSGLVRLEKISGTKHYGSKAPRAHRGLKSVFKTAALSATQSNNCFTKYYEYMCHEKRLSDYKARHAVARLVATSALAVMRSGKKFNPQQIGALKSFIT
jgi:transposase